MNSNCSCCPETLNSGQNQLFFVPCDLEIQWMTLKNDRDPLLCYINVISSSMHHFKAIGEFKLKLSPETLNSGQNRRFFVPCDLQIWWMTLKNNRAPLLYYFKLCAAFRSHWWIKTGVTVRKRLIWVKIDDFLAVWPWNLTDDNRAHLLSIIKLYASFRHQIWIQTGVTVRKRVIWVKFDDV